MKYALAPVISIFLTLSLSATEPELVESKEIPTIQITPDTELKVFADQKSHGVTSPTALTIDEKGRVLITETWRFGVDLGIDDNRRRRHWLLDDIASQTTMDRLNMYRKWDHKHPLTSYTKISEKIRMLVDENDNGVADKHTIFAQGFNGLLDGTAAGIFSFNGNVYFACIPHIFILKDKDDDGVADSRNSIQDGFGVRISLSGHDLNGFTLGPDGRIYATIGDRGFNIKTKEGKHYAYPDQGAILRFDPDGSNMEVYQTGLRNPKEIAFDQYGNPITVDNNSDQGDMARIVYLMEGADAGWTMDHQVMHTFNREAGFEKRPINRWMQEKMWEPLTEKNKHLQPAYILPPLMNLTNGPSGLTYHPGPASYPGKQEHFLISDYKGAPDRSRIHSFAVANDGAGMRVTENHIFNDGVAVTDVEYGYDGKIYVTDFIEGWATKSQGRVYTLTKKGSENDPTIKEVKSLITEDFSKLDHARLITLLKHPDMRIRLRAQCALADAKKINLLEKSITANKGNVVAQLHGIWGLGTIARKGDPIATALLVSHAHKAHPLELKASIARYLGEVTAEKRVDAALMHLLEDDSPRVQSFAAISLGKRQYQPAFETLVKLVEKNNDQDVFLRHALVMGLLGTGTEKQIAALESHNSPAVHLAAVVALRRHKSPEIAKFIGKTRAVTDEAIRAIHDLPIESARHKVAELLPRFASSPGNVREFTPMMQRRLLHSAFRIGGDKNIHALLAFIGSKNKTIDLKQRREAVRLLSLWNNPHPVDQSLGRLDPLPKRNNPNLIKILHKELPGLIDVSNPVVAELISLISHYKPHLNTIPAERLLAISRDQKISSDARSEALRSVAANPPKDFNDQLRSFVADKDPQVAGTALSLHVERNPGASWDLILQAAATERPVPLRQTAWSLVTSLEKIDSTIAKSLNQELSSLTAGKGDQHAALEILTAAKKHPQAAAALKKYQASLDAKNPLAPYLATLEGGNMRRGRALFNSHPAAQCMRCHTTYQHSDAAMAGPNLYGVASRGDRLFLLESLVNPNAKVAKGFGEVSAMPPVGLLMEKHEIRDLVEFLSTLKER
ncbi:MAG: HEAT repeat domain-containing protein [Akkermansiaceae bacterium]